MSRKVTIKDVAAECGLSKSTVAYVLSNDPSYKPSARSLALVKEAARKLGYRANMTAKALSCNKFYSIGIIFPSLKDRYYAEIASNLQSCLMANGYIGIFAFWETLSDVDRVFETVLSKGVDGIITVQPCNSLLTETIPSVIFENKHPQLDSIYSDSEYFIQTSIDYLMELGHSRIGFIGSFNDKRFLYFKAVMEEKNLCYRDEWTFNGSGFLNTGGKGIRQILSNDSLPTAIITHNDAVALSAMHVASKMGFNVPEDLSIIGHDNIDESEYYMPSLTTFGKPTESISPLLVETIIDRIKNPHRERQEIILKPELIIRESCRRLK